MKQHITPEQLNELSEKGKERLREWCKDKHYSEDAIEKMFTPDSPLKKNYIWPIPLLSIGQMIEFLDKHQVDFSNWIEFNPLYKPENSAKNVKPRQWQVAICRYRNNGETLWDKQYFKKELCDALWEAVKEILDKP